jgi:hypothetical protein
MNRKRKRRREKMGMEERASDDRIVVRGREIRHSTVCY